MRENPISKRVQGPDAMPMVPRWEFFQTIAGPGETEYPDEGDSPYCYYAKQLKNVTFTEAVGSPTLNFDLTDKLAYVFNLAQEDYIEVNSVILAQRKNGRWWTVDKVRVTIADIYEFGSIDKHNEGYTVASDSWADYTDVPQVHASMAVSLAGLAYAISHTAFLAGAARLLDEFTPSANSWASKTTATAAFQRGMFTAAIGGKIYLGGVLGFSVPALQSWDQAGDSWASLTAHSGSYNLLGAAYATDGTDAYVFGGGSTPADDTLIYDVSGGSWSTGTDMPRNRANGVAFTNGTSAYVMGGTGGTDNETNDIYDFSGDSWSTGTDMPRDDSTDRLNMGGTLKGSSGYVMGGRYNGLTDNQSFRNDAYSTSGDSWSSLEDTPTTRSGGASATAP